MQGKNWFAMIAAGAMLGFGAGLSGCDVQDEGVYDETEENLDEAGDAVEDAAEDTGDAIDEGLNETPEPIEENPDPATGG